MSGPRTMQPAPAGPDFGAVHAALARQVSGALLAGVASAVLRGRDLIDLHCTGLADREQGLPMQADTLCRAFSNTKLLTSCAVLLLWEEGRLGLDDPVEAWLPALGRPRVLRPGATTLEDTEPARGPITVRQLLSHTSGLGYGLLDPGTLLFRAYNERRVRSPHTTLAEMVDTLGTLPLAFHPGTDWAYSIATDVLARLVEVVSGERFDRFLQSRITGPLGMVDTGFVVPEGQHHRLAAYYAGADPGDPLKPGLTRLDHAPHAGAYLRAFPRLSGGGGLVTTLHDMVALLRSLVPGGPTLLRPATLALMMSPQLPPGVWVQFPESGPMPGKSFGLGGAVTVAPSAQEPTASAGEFEWGGMAGTHWWISPRTGLAGVLMTQRLMGFWHPYAFEFKRGVYAAAAGATP